MSYKCEICKDVLGYRDEVILLDCNGEDSLDAEHGGSGDIYGIVCTTCRENEDNVYLINKMIMP